MSHPIEDGSTVKIEYTLRDDAGEIIDSNEGGDPLSYVQGRQDIIRGLETALAGLRPGDARHLIIGPEDAYGFVDPEAVTEVARHLLPPEGQVPGIELTAKTRGGEKKQVTVREVRETTVLIDLNHPLAGKTLHFDIKIVDVTPPTS